MREEIRQIQQRLNLTAIYVTHDQEEAMAVSDRIIVMKNAEIAQEGTPADLYERPNSAFIADFIGDANLLPVEVTKAGDRTEVRLDGQTLTLPTAFAATGKADLVLRPHQVRISREPGAGTLPAEVAYAAYLGNQMQYTLTTALGEIFAITRRWPIPSCRASVHLGFDPAAARLVAV
ncbi:MAG: ABC transporter ATP-binding protein [Paracoccaceae bacterium]